MTDTWMNLKNTTLTKRSQLQEDHVSCYVTYTEVLGKAQLERQEADLWLSGAGVDARMACKWAQGHFGDEESILNLYYGDGWTPTHMP